MQDNSSDHDERIRDFYDRHGGPGRPTKEVELDEGDRGWSETYAQDGYVLRCDWNRVGSREEMTYTERSPR